MINFFRKIRKKLADDNKPLKYMRYAIGEIVLVVIGILIALSINNWNDVNKEKKIEIEYLGQLVNDLNVDLITFDTTIGSLNRTQKDLRYIIAFFSNREAKTLDTTKLIQSIVNGADFGWSYPKSVNTTFDELKSTGNLSLIKNAKLRTKIIAYQEFNKHENERIDERRSDYPNATYTLIPRSPDDDFLFHEGVIPNQLIMQRILHSNLNQSVIAQLNYSRFMKQRHLALRKKAQELLVEINGEIHEN